MIIAAENDGDVSSLGSNGKQTLNVQNQII